MSAGGKTWQPLLLSFNAGFVDTAGFLTLHGLFTAHVTGNFVTFGAALTQGGSGIVAKLLALPVFCAVVMAARLMAGAAGLRPLLIVKIVLLVLAAAVLIGFGPFPDADRPAPLLGGMLLVSAMALQNAMQRIHLTALPPSTLMTGNTTQIIIDLADAWRGLPGEAERRQRLRRLGGSVAGFAAGCLTAALALMLAGLWAFLLPPVLGLLVLLAVM
ncbi:conserved membrane protein of unknown function [Rhodovastum atsumiense]|uniref:DUF1275 domain-containing protein n=1 Tax=Rhodovastum atsumiense TaxID=504468 RepID=A0A5M6IT02_9PROT|nr:DUF1275 family protein [Rhodovastum atsumiense]KAA5611444.1 DUF1275 domain-containing protein [Rhodovastum atsumiense]CAH2601127.1 conserved membrane protein of unknown function [Rhodovastum atsumiense]